MGFSNSQCTAFIYWRNNQQPKKKFVVETNIDDLNPQIYDYLIAKLLKNGALDVWLTPILMKKNRPANTLAVLVNAEYFDDIVEIIFSETSSIGLRYREVQRVETKRYIKLIDTPYGAISAKYSFYKNRLTNISAEYDDCKAAAIKQQIPLKTIQSTVIMYAKQQLLKGDCK